MGLGVRCVVEPQRAIWARHDRVERQPVVGALRALDHRRRDGEVDPAEAHERDDAKPTAVEVDRAFRPPVDPRGRVKTPQRWCM